MLTTELFLWTMGIVIAIILAFLIPILLLIAGLKADLKPISSLVRTVDDFIRSRGLEHFVKGQGSASHHSLTPEKAVERDTLVAISRERVLFPPEAARLKELLEEDARNDFARGVIGALALAVLLVTIGAIITSLSQQR